MKSLIFIHSLFLTFSIGSIFSDENQENDADANRSAVICNSSFEEGDGEEALGWELRIASRQLGLTPTFIQVHTVLM